MRQIIELNKKIIFFFLFEVIRNKFKPITHTCTHELNTYLKNVLSELFYQDNLVWITPLVI